MKFLLQIELGNDAMQTGQDVASALDLIAEPRATLPTLTMLSDGDSGNIRDSNGNTVGKWEVVE